MKTLKLVLALTIISLATVVYSGNVPKKTQFVVATTLSNAIQNPDLVQCMYLQLDDDFIRAEQKGSNVITQQVFHLNTVYTVTGTFEEWVAFFVMDNMPGKSVSQVKTNTHK